MGALRAQHGCLWPLPPRERPTLTLEKIRALALRYYPSAEEVEAEIARDIRGTQLYVIEIEHLTGKQIKEK